MLDTAHHQRYHNNAQDRRNNYNAVAGGSRFLCPLIFLMVSFFLISLISQQSKLLLTLTTALSDALHLDASGTYSSSHTSTGGTDEDFQKLNAKIENLQFQLDMQLVRQVPIPGPMSLKALPDETQAEFKRGLKLHLWGDEHVKRLEDGRNGKSAWGQVPSQATGLMTREGSRWKRHWTHALIQKLVDNVMTRDDISPPEYPSSALELQQAMEDHVRPSYSNPKILVAGSISPWVEAIALAVTNVTKVYMADWQPIDIEGDDRIECILMPDLVRNRPDRLFDVIVSFSSIEHDGLGRYGDPINPNGDMAAMAEFYTLLQPGGMLLLGIPYCVIETENVTDTNIRHWARLQGNVHRVYGSKRLERMLYGFTLLDRVDPGTPELAHRFGIPFGKSFAVSKEQAKWQPVFVLKKDVATKPLLLR